MSTLKKESDLNLNSNLEKITTLGDDLLKNFVRENEVAGRDLSVENLCKVGMRRIRIAREFALYIDEKLYSLATKRRVCSSDFLIDILSLESKRLAFKEEANKKCQDLKEVNQQKI